MLTDSLRIALFCIFCALNGCALFSARDPLNVQLAGVAPAPGAELEWRMNVSLRIQNPNREPIDYSGVALKLEINDQPLASGVSPAHGRLEGYSETLLNVPMAVSAFSVVRQAFGLASLRTGTSLPYRLEGKLDAPGLGRAVRFVETGRLDAATLMPSGLGD